MTFIAQTLKGLKNRLDKELCMIASGPEGQNKRVICSFNEPATKEQIEEFEMKKQCILPEDYKEFLLIHNGCSLLDLVEEDGENVGGGLWLYSLEELENTYSIMQEYNPDEPLTYIPIGNVLEQTLAISNKKINDQEPNYLLIFDIPAEKYIEPIELNFELFVDRYIQAQGESFWTWPIYTATNYYES